MSNYKLRVTKNAEQDLDDVYSEGFLTWGEKQADRYYDGLLARFDRMCENPMLDRVVDEIRVSYRRSIYEKHSIFFVILEDTVEVRAVVKRQDITLRL
jgi:toxin ParE1/3/4